MSHFSKFDVPPINSLRELCDFVLSRKAEATFVRWSVRPDKDLEAGYCSTNWSSGDGECGLSAKTIFCDAERAEIDVDFILYVARTATIYGTGSQKGEKGWLLSGKRIGTGADNEPLLENCFMLAILSAKCVKECDAFMVVHYDWRGRGLGRMPEERIVSAQKVLKKAGL